jgi:hypothetical protein
MENALYTGVSVRLNTESEMHWMANLRLHILGCIALRDGQFKRVIAIDQGDQFTGFSLGIGAHKGYGVSL